MRSVCATVLLLMATGLLTVFALSSGARQLRIEGTARIQLAAFGLLSALVVALDAAGVTIVLMLAGCTVSAVTDLRTGLVLDRVTLPALIAAFGCALLSDAALASLCGSLCAAGSLYVLWFITKGRGIGLGDVKLAALIGAALGPTWSLTALGAAFVAGTIVHLPALCTGRIGRRTAIAFAPYLAIGAQAAVLARAGMQ